MKIKTLNKIASVGINALGQGYEVNDTFDNPDGILVRSANMLEAELPENLKAIARAGAGVNNIPLDRCSEKGIVVFNTPGANANAVKELAVCALLLASRNIVGGINWANGLTEDVAKSVEKGKSAFAGCEIKGKTLGIIGLGAIGGMLANTAIHLGMNVLGCDPFISIDNAWRLDRHVTHVATFDDIYKNCDYISLHVPATADTKGMINAEAISKMKDGVKILNLARGELINAADLKAALEAGKVSTYVTDFPNEEVINTKNIITIPHLGASTEESEDNCAIMAAEEITDYLENGNIKNSVNYPEATLERSGKARICILHKNIPAILNQITGVVAEKKINIDNLTNKSKGENAYTILDVAEIPTADDIAKIESIEGIARVRVLN